MAEQTCALKVTQLASGGLITNYYCSSGCRHCLYRSGPDWEKQYIDPAAARANTAKAVSLGCRSLHIGGGEPFLNLDGLEAALGAVREAGAAVEYVETNSSWFKDPASADAALTRLKAAGLACLLVSISPFHNERIPLVKTKGVLAACRRCGIAIFPWVEEFLPEMELLDENKTHTLEEYRARFGADYLRRIPGRYWIHFGGRALETFREVFPLNATDEILARSSGGCRELADTGHFHIDLFGNYVPGLCAGLAIAREDLGAELGAVEYPYITALAERGIAGLLALAAERFGFKPEGRYLNKCDLCHSIRRFVFTAHGVRSKDLQPAGHYR